MATVSKPKVPIMSTAGAIPFRNEKGQHCFSVFLSLLYYCYMHIVSFAGDCLYTVVHKNLAINFLQQHLAILTNFDNFLHLTTLKCPTVQCIRKQNNKTTLFHTSTKIFFIKSIKIPT